MRWLWTGSCSWCEITSKSKKRIDASEQRPCFKKKGKRSGLWWSYVHFHFLLWCVLSLQSYIPENEKYSRLLWERESLVWPMNYLENTRSRQALRVVPLLSKDMNNHLFSLRFWFYKHGPILKYCTPVLIALAEANEGDCNKQDINSNITVIGHGDVTDFKLSLHSRLKIS